MRHVKPIPSIEVIGDVVNRALEAFPAKVRIIAEPGRYLVSDAGYFVCRIMGTATRANKRWMHLDAGLFGGIIETAEGLKYKIRTDRAGPDIPWNVAGPTCDSIDVVMRDEPLPSDLQEGDYLYLRNAGAYTTAYASNFNGSPCPHRAKRRARLRVPAAPNAARPPRRAERLRELAPREQVVNGYASPSVALDLGEVEALRERHGEGVDLCAADHEGFAARFHRGERGIQRMDYGAAGRGPVGRARNHDIVAAGKRRPDRLEGLSSHDDRVAQREPLEAPQVLGQPPGHGVVTADGAVPGQGGDEGDAGGVAHRAIVLKVVELSAVLPQKSEGKALDSLPSQACILVVDDDPKNRMAMEALLQSSGHSVVLAESGEEALRRTLEQDFAVILMDARMPGVDGFATARAIRERERSRSTPIIFLTGAYEDLSSMFRGYEAGAVDYMVKPIVPEVLKFKISIFVDLYAKKAALTREIGERRRAEEHLRNSEENLRALAARLQSVREEEWTRIAREIHDELGQALTGLKMDLTWVASKLPPDQKALAAKTESMFDLIDGTIQSVRKIATRLRPEVLDELGLGPAIEWQAKEFQKRSGVRCKLSLVPGDAAIDRDRSTAAFRIFQELLTNVARHASATRLDVSMRVDGGVLVLEVEDNGKGIDEAALLNPKSLGILGMRERALPFGGDIEITGARDQGTRVRVSIPLALK